ncbi:carbonic anhydrase 2-like [Drosophila rhopaloa]|uniref:Carbonic anhydrase n=1 Tax=Drosophila rhopaloa TaxID=1041015 RepID=A0A6P4E6U9_DRORH|nr:carbonic anhydrase 2-like [Drosophila rhopaloa]
MQPNGFHKYFLLYITLAYQHSANGSEWDHIANGMNWTGTCATGLNQSPISLNVEKAETSLMPRVFFGNYKLKLKGPISIINNGHTVFMNIPKTTNGKKPFIIGGTLKNRYEADGLHFHWGSKNSQGSEHLINNERFDLEMHIVHRNNKYKDIIKAVGKTDGLTVVGVLLKIVKKPKRKFPSLNRVLAAVAKIRKDNAKTTIRGGFSLGQMIGNVNPHDFFTYRGSLTTPSCQEAVTWIVFSEVLPVTYSSVSNFWKLLDHNNQKIINNFRSVQRLNGRHVFYRI